MSTENNKEFYQLLNEIVELQTFDLSLSDGSSVKCKQLTTSQLKDLIKSIVDSPLTQAEFNTTASKIFKNSQKAYVVTEGVGTKADALDLLDRNELPESLNKALYSFLVAMAIRILRMEGQHPMSMLIHIDHKKESQWL